MALLTLFPRETTSWVTALDTVGREGLEWGPYLTLTVSEIINVDTSIHMSNVLITAGHSKPNISPY